MIYIIKLCNKTIHNVKSEKIFCLCPNNILYQRYNILFLMTYLLLNTINFARFGIRLSEVQNVPVNLRDMILCFPAMDRCKFKWAMDESIEMGEIEPFLKGT
jgi:hypothetical protein